MLEDGDARGVPVALRTVAEAVGGMTVFAEKTGLSRDTLYRTLSERRNPRLNTLAAIVAAFNTHIVLFNASVRGTRLSESWLEDCMPTSDLTADVDGFVATSTGRRPEGLTCRRSTLVSAAIPFKQGIITSNI
jgi:probable addiction module antidote protein